MGEIKGFHVHQVAINLLRGSDYRVTVLLGQSAEGFREIQITIPFPPDFTDDLMARLMDEVTMGIYLPRSEATKGLTERKDDKRTEP